MNRTSGLHLYRSPVGGAIAAHPRPRHITANVAQFSTPPAVVATKVAPPVQRVTTVSPQKTISLDTSPVTIHQPSKETVDVTVLPPATTKPAVAVSLSVTGGGSVHIISAAQKVWLPPGSSVKATPSTGVWFYTDPTNGAAVLQN